MRGSLRIDGSGRALHSSLCCIPTTGQIRRGRANAGTIRSNMQPVMLGMSLFFLSLNGFFCFIYWIYPKSFLISDLFQNFSIVFAIYEIVMFYILKNKYGMAVHLVRYLKVNTTPLLVFFYLASIFLYFNPFVVLYFKGSLFTGLLYLIAGLFNLHWMLQYQFKVKPLMEKYNNILD